MGTAARLDFLMKFLRNLIIEKDDLSRLPKDVMTAIKSNIRKGAEDLNQKWANALELVHRAYKVEGVQRPDPTMGAAWEQYEENLTYAVQQLSKNRGMDGDWRMSSSIFHEAHQPQHKYCVSFGNQQQIIEAHTVDEIIQDIERQSSYDVSVLRESDHVDIYFSRWGVRKKNLRVSIDKLD